MIKVNLLSTVPGAAPPRDWLPREQRSALIGLCLLLTTAAGVGGWWFYLHNERAKIDTRIATAENDLVKLKEAAKLVDTLNKRKTELSERLAVIERLRAEKRGPVTLLETVSRSIPDGLWLLEIKQAGVTVQVDGRAMSLTAVTDFTEQLQNSGMFQRPVEILTTGTETFEDRNVVRFTVKADVVPLEPAPTAQAPASAPTSVAGTVPTKAGA